jgi:multidrug efflux pump
MGAAMNSRRSIGTGVIGGMLAATVIAVFFIPMFYYVIESLMAKFGGADKAAKGTSAGPVAGGGVPAANVPHSRREDD